MTRTLSAPAYEAATDKERDELRAEVAYWKEQRQQALSALEAVTEQANRLCVETQRLRKTQVDIGGIGGSQDSPSPIQAVQRIADLAAERDKLRALLLETLRYIPWRRGESERLAARVKATTGEEGARLLPSGRRRRSP